MSDLIDKVVITIRYYAGENIRPPKCLEDANKPCWVVEMDEITHEPFCVETLEEARQIAEKWSKNIKSNPPEWETINDKTTVEIVEQPK